MRLLAENISGAANLLLDGKLLMSLHQSTEVTSLRPQTLTSGSHFSVCLLDVDEIRMVAMTDR